MKVNMMREGSMNMVKVITSEEWGQRRGEGGAGTDTWTQRENKEETSWRMNRQRWIAARWGEGWMGKGQRETDEGRRWRCGGAGSRRRWEHYGWIMKRFHAVSQHHSPCMALTPKCQQAKRASSSALRRVHTLTGRQADRRAAVCLPADCKRRHM